MKKRLYKVLAAVLIAVLFLEIGGVTLEASAAQKDTATTTVEKKTTGKDVLSASEIFEKCSSACVEIRVTDSCGAVYIGSGFFVGKYNVITNQHVIDNASKLQVFAIDGTEYTLTSIYGIDEKLDLALLRVKEKNKNYMKFAEETPKTGETVYSIGNPVGVTGTFVRGMVSNDNRRSDRLVSGQKYFQLDMPSGKGIGGAPVINEKGEAAGVMCLTVPSGQNMNLAIVPESVNKFLSGLKKKDRISLADYYEQHKDGLVTPNAIDLIKESSYTNTAAVYDGEYEELSPEEIYNQTVPGVVRVFVYTKMFGQFINSGGGTGFFAEPDKVVTNYHIVRDFSPVTTMVCDYVGNIYEVTDITLGNAYNDTAILTVNLVKSVEGGEDFKPTILHLDKEYVPAPGEEIYAIGNPQNYDYTFSNGIVSIPSAKLDGVEYTVHCAATSPGSSGGVLLNRFGDVIGITNMMVLVCENMSCSVKIKYAVDLLSKKAA